MFKSPKGISLSDVQEHNRSLILQIIHSKGECSRKDISVETGLDQATISRVVNRLIETELVEEVSLLKNKRGRRSIGVSFCANSYRIISLRLQRRNFDIAVFDLLGTIVSSHEYPIDLEGEPQEIFNRILLYLIPIVEKFRDNLIGVGVALPGPFLADTEKIILMTETRWKNFDFLAELRQYLENLSVFSIHDAYAAALSVWYNRSYTLQKSIMLYISAGQGIGSAIVMNGQIFQGSHGLAGEIGHTSVNIDGPQCKCGNHGCLELYTSSFTLIRRVQAAMSVESSSVYEEINLSLISTLYQQGNPIVEHEVEQVIRYLAQGMANYINIINPEVVIVGDEYVCFGKKFINSLQKEIKKSLLPSIFEMLYIDFIDTEDDLVLRGAFFNVLNKALFKM